MSELEIRGDKKFWRLKRQRILGKGSFGCATLYEEVGDGVSEGSEPSYVVVKDVNMQTMKKEEELKALEMEVSILRRSIGHPNIVQFLDYHHDGEFMAYIVMEFCTGGDLGQRIEQLRYRREKEDERFVASLMIQMLVGLNFLHVDQRTLHRDIKPQNIFIFSDGTVRIGDFGVSVVLDQLGGVAKMACGSPFYMAPELCEERAYDGKADVWSLGVTLYELMTLKRPFNSTSAPALVRLISSGEFDRITPDDGFSAPLIDLVHSFLQKSAVTRPTLRRALRSSYVQNNLYTVPLACLQSKYYKEIFGEELVQKAITTQTKAVGVGSGGNLGGKSNVASVGGDGVISRDAPSSSTAPGKASFSAAEIDLWLQQGTDAAEELIQQSLAPRRPRSAAAQ
ncbi:unnamed protein product [Trypanosoma congolense IL3000]|uniref:non-specific serine/threonine protein kinase n=1 Tax=Trypanosoma congolense (strain IL3000) TaxID=1068625 RepID=F9WCC6_TRYCI|nr:unnamed protein product [Trypanosoma congolense IL3000]